MSRKSAFWVCAALLSSAPAMAQPAAEPMGDQRIDPGAEPPGDPAGAPGATAPAPPVAYGPPPPTAEFVSTGALQWEVLIDRQPVCVTPCSLGVPRGRWVSMRTRERRPVRVEVGMLGEQPVTVAAKPLHNGAYATGVTFTALGGTAVVTGIVLTAVGCATDRDGMCTAGLITGGVGAVVTAGSIWLMTRAVPRVRIHRHAGLAVGPGGGAITGRF